jgi:hypothetical protein
LGLPPIQSKDCQCHGTGLIQGNPSPIAVQVAIVGRCQSAGLRAQYKRISF